MSEDRCQMSDVRCRIRALQLIGQYVKDLRGIEFSHLKSHISHLVHSIEIRSAAAVAHGANTSETTNNAASK